ncbi:sulfotransferase family protein [Pseudolysobacter antarcticus]|uniref:Sulfotransferase family protein n=1 Tax=Pseudolysobacter antarcticus TaxID=2511995 RepID=A0A411HG94_9GAMM|nr:tetratricopeptide repeat-containing sulfotransferase family protein [Pseudolysobacter antarcticus]QBB69512.1 sulfotransferase family protein [Pseudolysobacter antarcticus]
MLNMKNGAERIAEYQRAAEQRGTAFARDVLLAQLEKHPPEEWLDCARLFILRGDTLIASALLQRATVLYPASSELAYAFAGILSQQKNYPSAEALLSYLLEQHPDDIAATFLLAKIFKQQGKMHAVGVTISALFEHVQTDIESIIQAVELLDECGRKHEAAALCEKTIAAGSSDARLYAYAGMIAIQLGNFELARERYLFALAHNPRAMEWQAPLALTNAQRYRDASHPDFALLQDCLQRTTADDKARASILFALGKAHDDIGDYATAARYFSDANAMANHLVEWSRKNWRRAVEARLASRKLPAPLAPVKDFAPLFIVGAPRSGTTLVAELLGRHPDVCNRGELAWLPYLAQRLSLAGKIDTQALREVADTYLQQLRQDDSNAFWMIDKQPLNFLNIDLIATLFPNARIIHCQRSSRDTALSIWSQYFAGRENDFAYDFADIAAVLQGCNRLMAHWKKTSPLPIHTVHYEQLASDPQNTLAALGAWLELSEQDLLAAKPETVSVGTSSLWQVRQPIYSRSIGRWQAYADYIPELKKLFSE